MLSHLKARELAPAPKERGKQEILTSSKSTTNLDAEQRAAAQLTCDALCSLASGIGRPTPSSTNPVTALTPSISSSIPGQSLGVHGFLYASATAPVVTVPGTPQPAPSPTSALMTTTMSTTTSSATTSAKTSTTKIKSCPKQHQLPLFLSKTYHMIDRCDPDIATWSATGDNFVVKNVEKFASAVLPLYFKHSNFSSFARQLNFYGFRKLRSDPILTNDVDPQTSCYVRFYHEKFQKNKPELLHGIKRATKSDQQSKDDVDDLKAQVFKLKKCVLDMSTQMERKISEINYEYNRRISGLTVEYEKLASLVGQLLQPQQHLQNQYKQSSQQQQQQQQQQQLSPNCVLSSTSQHPLYIPKSPSPPIVESTTVIPTKRTCKLGSGNTITTSSSSLSTTTTSTSAATRSVGTSEPTHKMESLSHAVALSMMADNSSTTSSIGSTELATTSTKATSIPKNVDGATAGCKRAAPTSVESLEFPAIRPKIN